MTLRIVATLMQTVPCAAALVLGTCVPGLASAQGPIVDAGFGAFRGSRPTYNGPVFHVRVSAPVRRSMWAGARFTYRDDDPSSGRARSAAVLAEAHLVLEGRTGAIYVPVGFGVEWVSVTTSNSLPPGDARSAAYLAADVGLGIELNGGTRRLIMEARQAFRTFGNSQSLSLGLRSYATTRSSSTNEVDLAVSSIASFNSRYARDQAYQGYALTYVHPLQSRFPTDWRAGLGIDFLEFDAGGRSWSTGAVAAMVGIGHRVASTPRGTVRLTLVSQVGLLQFAEPGGRAPSPLLALGGELRVTPRALGIVGGYHAVLAGGPASTLSAGQLRIGLTVQL